MPETVAVNFFVFFDTTLDKQEKLLVVGSPGRSAGVAIYKNILKRGKEFPGLGVAAVGKFVINILFELVLSLHHFLNLVSIIDRILQYFPHLVVVSVKSNLTLL